MKTKAKKAPKTIRFGSVTVPVVKLTSAEIKRNVLAGQRALARVTKRLKTPGVELNLPPDVPSYHADSNNLGRIIRVLNGKEESGVLVNGKFQVVS